MNKQINGPLAIACIVVVVAVAVALGYSVMNRSSALGAGPAKTVVSPTGVPMPSGPPPGAAGMGAGMQGGRGGQPGLIKLPPGRS